MSLPRPDFQIPPGTVRLFQDDGTRINSKVVRQPQPSSDPNDPLNWTMRRKMVNLVPILLLTSIIFSQYSINGVFWQLWVVDLNMTYGQLTITSALSLIGTAFGCVVFIPFAIKYGRRPVYIVSIAILAVCAIWQAVMKTYAENYAVQLINGLCGATNETIVQMTIADLFFVHQRGTANGLYMINVMAGSFLSPVVAGYMANDGNWRRCYWILFGFDVFLLFYFAFLYEESKYVPLVVPEARQAGLVEATEIATQHDDTKATAKDHIDVDIESHQAQSTTPSEDGHIDYSIPMNTYRQRMRLTTPTGENLLQTAWRPFPVLVNFPVVAYTAIQYSFGLAWISVIGATIAIIYPYAPYNMSPSGIGLMSLGSFIGCILGSVYGGLLSDVSVLFFAKRNRGYYEPEMRLHIVHLPVLCQAAGILTFGITTAKGMHWIYPAVGSAFFGFGLGAISDISLTLTIDCYRGVTGEAFVSIACIRNLASIAFYFAIEPWFNHQGIMNMYIVVTVLAVIFASLHIPLIIWGKKIRVKTAPRYAEFVAAKGETRM